MPFLKEEDTAFVRTRRAQDLRDDATMDFFARANGRLVLHLQVSVTPTSPPRPHAARLAAFLAVEISRVRADIVEAGEFPDLAERYNVYAVPKIVINDTVEFVGAQPEAEFVRYVAQAGGLQEAPPADE